MQEIIKLISIALITVVSYVILKQVKPELALFVTLAGSIIIVIMAMTSLGQIIQAFRGIFSKTGIDGTLLSPLIKIIAIGYIAEFGASICVDAGASSIADKVLFGAKIVILVLSLPIISSVVDMVVSIL